MTTQRSVRASLLGGLLALSPLGAGHAAGPPRCPFSTPGLVVEAVDSESAGFRAGFRPGDRLFSWCRTAGGKRGCDARGDLRSPFGWRDVELEEMQRGGVVVAGARGAQTLRWSLAPASQSLAVAPLLHGALAEAYRAARDRERAGDPAAAAQELERAAELAAENDCAGEELWLRDQAAGLRAQARQWPEADAGYQAALEKARALKAARVETHLLMSWGNVLLQRGEFARGKQQLESALRLEGKQRAESVLMALILLRLGAMADRQDDLDEEDRLFQRAYDMVRRLAPGSGAEAATANNLAATTALRGD